MLRNITFILACVLARTVFAIDFGATVADLGSDDYSLRNEARTALKRTLSEASKPGVDSSALEGLQTKIAAELGEGLPLPSRLFLIRCLELYGTSDSMDVLYPLLGDSEKEVRDSARRALASIPDSKISANLQTELAKASNERKSDFVAALVYQGDVNASPAIARLLTSDDATVVKSAVLALGKLGDKNVLSDLVELHGNASLEMLPLVEASLLDIGIDDDTAENLCIAGSNAAIRAGAFQQLVDGNARRARKTLNRVLDDSNFVGRDLFLRIALDSENSAMLKSLAAALSKVSVDDQIVIIGTAGELGLSRFESEVLALLPSAEGVLKDTIIESLSRLGGDMSFSALYDQFLADPKNRLLEAAVVRIQAPSADAKAIATLKGGASVEDKASAIKLIALRNAPGTTELLNNIVVNADDVNLRGAAYQGLESVGSLKSVQLLVDSVLEGGPTMRPAQRSLKRLSLNFGAADYLWEEVYQPALDSASDDKAREGVMAILDGVDSEQALAYLESHILDTSSPLRDAALRTLNRWASINAGNVWLSIISVEGVSPEFVASAQKGIIRLISSKGIDDASRKRLQLVVNAVQAAPTASFKKAIVEKFGRVELQWYERSKIEQTFEPIMDDPDIAEELKMIEGL